MVSIFNTLINNNPLEITFFAAALIGSLFFLVRTLFLLMGTVVDTDVDSHYDADYSADMAHDFDHHELPNHDGNSLRVFSLHSLSGFLMMFGWTGLACYKQLALSPLATLGFATLAGLSTMLVSAYLFAMSKKLQSNGAVLSTEKAVDKIACVYSRIPAHGTGKIQLEIGNITYELLARSTTNRKIDSFKKVRVVCVLDQETVLVEELS